MFVRRRNLPCASCCATGRAALPHQMHAPIHPPACSAPSTNPAPSCCLPVPPDACRRHTLRFLTVYITFLPFAFWCVCLGGGALGCAWQLYHALQLGQSLLQRAMLTLARPCFLSPAIPAPLIFRHLPFLPASLDPRPIFGWATLPVMGVLTFLLAGVENVGTQTEEPSRWAGATAAPWDAPQLAQEDALPIPSCSGNYTCPKPTNATDSTFTTHPLCAGSCRSTRSVQPQSAPLGCCSLTIGRLLGLRPQRLTWQQRRPHAAATAMMLARQRAQQRHRQQWQCS